MKNTRINLVFDTHHCKPTFAHPCPIVSNLFPSMALFLDGKQARQVLTCSVAAGIYLLC